MVIKAFVAGKLHAQLEHQAKEWLSNPVKGVRVVGSKHASAGAGASAGGSASASAISSASASAVAGAGAKRTNKATPAADQVQVKLLDLAGGKEDSSPGDGGLQLVVTPILDWYGIRI